MSDSHLPVDFSEWPDNPRELLNVPDNADVRILRRAYTKLIRQYKPDHHPQEFQRIRDAYETLKQYAEWFAYDLQEMSEQEETSVSEKSEGTDFGQQQKDHFSNQSSLKSVQDDSPPAYRLEDEINSAWKLEEEDPREAYKKLIELQSQNMTNEEIGIRLYWLLKLDSSLDSRRVDSDWLLTIMRVNGLHGRAFELYRMAVNRNAELALSVRSTALLSPTEHLPRLYELLTMRWRAAGRLNRPHAIANDIKAVRELFILDDTQNWVRLLLVAADQVAWMKQPSARELLQKIQDELEEFSDLQLQMNYEFERYEMLFEMTRDLIFEDVSNVPEQLIQVIKDSWTMSYYEVKPDLMNLLKTWVQRPNLGLQEIDQLKFCSFFATEQIERLVDTCYYPSEESDNQKTINNELINRILWRIQRKDYREQRVKLLEFCIENAIPVNQVLDYLAEAESIPRDPDHVFLHALHQDSALEIVYKGCHVFWQ